MVADHHRRSIRILGYDYTQQGAYFITCVTWQRRHLFGEIVDGDLKLNILGNLVKKEWERLPKRFPAIDLDEYIVMPNHIHGIILIRDVGARPCGHGGVANSDSFHDSPRDPTAEKFGTPVVGARPCGHGVGRIAIHHTIHPVPQRKKGLARRSRDLSPQSSGLLNRQ